MSEPKELTIEERVLALEIKVETMQRLLDEIVDAVNKLKPNNNKTKAN